VVLFITWSTAVNRIYLFIFFIETCTTGYMKCVVIALVQLKLLLCSYYTTRDANCNVSFAVGELPSHICRWRTKRRNLHFWLCNMSVVMKLIQPDERLQLKHLQLKLFLSGFHFALGITEQNAYWSRPSVCVSFPHGMPTVNTTACTQI